MNKNYAIYIMHYTKNVKRKELMKKILKKENCNKKIFFIEQYDKEDVRYIDYYMMFKADTLEWQNRGYREFSPHYPLKPEEISLSFKHCLSMQYLISSDDDFGLFLEDDAIIDEGFFEKLDDNLENVPDNFDVLFIGRGCKPSISNTPGWHFNQSDRNTDAMIISKRFAEQFLGHVDHNRMCYPIDHELNFFIKHTNSNVYWLEPPIVTQGSHLGIFDSFQDPHSRFLDKNLPVRSDLGELLK